jgi:hypothetical protein
MSTLPLNGSRARRPGGQNLGSPWRSPLAGPVAVQAGKESLHKYRQLKKHATPQKASASPLLPRLNALLSSRVDRYGRAQSKLAELTPRRSQTAGGSVYPVAQTVLLF